MVGWHWGAENPVNGGYNASGDPVVELMPGGTGNANWTRWLDTFATFVKSIRMPNGNLIPMIMRIFHENLGGSFWYLLYIYMIYVHIYNGSIILLLSEKVVI